jgi:hypothetical protein
LAAAALRRWPRAFVALGRLEAALLDEELAARRPVQPIFVCGLARAGTTITLELLCAVPGVVSHRYRDFPFVHVPVAWNGILKGAGLTERPPVERMHGDGIQVSPESPEALDEPLWMSFFPSAHDWHRPGLLTEDFTHPRFEAFYRAHLAKLLLVRGGARLALKGNYLLPRLPFLGRLFPDARFVLVVREPAAHIASLMRQHRIFARMQADRRARTYLQALGHFEFGLDRAPINMGDGAEIEEVMARWQAGDEVGGWALYWRHIHAGARAMLAARPGLAARTLVLRAETLRGDPGAAVDGLLDHCRLEAGAELRAALVRRLGAARDYAPEFDASQRATIAATTGAEAALWGYPGD